MKLTLHAAMTLAIAAFAPGQAAFAVPAYTFTDFDASGVNAASTAYGINNAGQIVGDYVSAGTKYGFVYDSVRGTTTTTLVVLTGDPSQFPFDNALGINDLGQVVGTAGLFNPATGRFVPVSLPTTNFGVEVSGIDNAGQIVGTYIFPEYATRGSYTFGTEGYLFTPASNSLINLALQFPNAFYAINNVGQVLGGVAVSGQATYGPFVYDPVSGNYTLVPIGAKGLNDVGQVVGTTTTGTTTQGLLFDLASGTSTTLNDPNGVNGTFLTDINNTGEIAGYYLDAQNVSHAFFALPEIATVPEPVSLALLGTSVVGLVVMRRKRRCIKTLE